MADPLTDVAEAYAPAPAETNFFDPVPGQSVLGRYGDINRIAEGAMMASKLSDQLQKTRMNETRFEDSRRRTEMAEESAKRQKTLFDRKEDEEAARQKALLSRGDYLRELGRLKAEDDKYGDIRDGIIERMPPELMEDLNIKSMIDSGNRDNDRYLRQREKEDTFQRNRETSLLKIAQNKAVQARLAGVPQDQIEALIHPETGEVDAMGLADLVLQAKEAKAATPTRSQVQSDIMQKARESVVDTEAFPTKMAEMYQRYSKNEEPPKDKETLEAAVKEAKDEARYFTAQEWDKDRVKNELDAARSMTEDKYINAMSEAGISLSNEAKEKRKSFWNAANSGASAPVAQPGAAVVIIGKPKEVNGEWWVPLSNGKARKVPNPNG